MKRHGQRKSVCTEMEAGLVWDPQTRGVRCVVARHTVITVPQTNGPVVVSPDNADSGGRADAEAEKRHRDEESFHTLGVHCRHVNALAHRPGTNGVQNETVMPVPGSCGAGLGARLFVNRIISRQTPV